MYQEELKVAVAIAYEAGDVMRKYFFGNQQRVIKGDGTPLTIADTAINSLVIERLATALPDDGVIGEEESTTDYGGGRKWFCDPIDGTKAYICGVPTAMFSLGLVIDGRAVLGVCYEPMTSLLYTAVTGEGAYRNGERISVNQETLDMGIVGTMSSHYRVRNEAPYLDELLRRQVDMAAFSGAVAKCVRVAEGRFVGYLEEFGHAHDVAAAQVIVEEAGGKLTKLDGSEIDYRQPFRGAIASNGLVHDELMTIYTTSMREAATR